MEGGEEGNGRREGGEREGRGREGGKRGRRTGSVSRVVECERGREGGRRGQGFWIGNPLDNGRSTPLQVLFPSCPSLPPSLSPSPKSPLSIGEVHIPFSNHQASFFPSPSPSLSPSAAVTCTYCIYSLTN